MTLTRLALRHSKHSDITVGKTNCDNEDPDTVYYGVSCGRVSDADANDYPSCLLKLND